MREPPGKEGQIRVWDGDQWVWRGPPEGRSSENPYKPGTFIAARWDLGRAITGFQAAVSRQAQRDLETIRRLLRRG